MAQHSGRACLSFEYNIKGSATLEVVLNTTTSSVSVFPWNSTEETHGEWVSQRIPISQQTDAQFKPQFKILKGQSPGYVGIKQITVVASECPRAGPTTPHRQEEEEGVLSDRVKTIIIVVGSLVGVSLLLMIMLVIRKASHKKMKSGYITDEVAHTSVNISTDNFQMYSVTNK
ncbi:uncharacterized protein LOC101850799 [Aplysia californica]|uniref:Uncharacterized protein LOC101850799 n=1 Tax=Aplysia californica TaxID=6500 RepID=A0ABM0JMM5_APLCA|nr:uncharacterized protein LOC101850799 [Aplysia californica]